MKPILCIIGLVWPEPDSSAAGTRMIQLIELFLAQDYHIVFASASQKTNFSYALEGLGIVCQSVLLNSDTFDDFIQKLNPQIVLFDRFISEEQFGWRVAEHCPHALRILDTEDLHCLRFARQNAIKKSQEFKLEAILEEEISLREIASIYRCDISLVISEVEMHILKDIFKIDDDLLFYLPLFFEKQSDILPFEARTDFVFIGNFLHEPNWDAVQQLKKVIWPHLKNTLKDAKLHIYGAYCLEKAFQMHHEKDGFLVHGRAENALKVISQARVLLAPLRFGAGIKGKLLEAMITGTPTVTTHVGAEGIAAAEQWNGFVSDDVGQFSEHAVKLYQDEILWKQKQALGFTVLEDRFAKETYTTGFLEKHQDVLANLSAHRNQNFLGKLLYHHQFMATKFMSKWITEKNNKKSF